MTSIASAFIFRPGPTAAPAVIEVPTGAQNNSYWASLGTEGWIVMAIHSNSAGARRQEQLMEVKVWLKPKGLCFNGLISRGETLSDSADPAALVRGQRPQTAETH